MQFRHLPQQGEGWEGGNGASNNHEMIERSFFVLIDMDCGGGNAVLTSHRRRIR